MKMIEKATDWVDPVPSNEERLKLYRDKVKPRHAGVGFDMFRARFIAGKKLQLQLSRTSK